MNELVQTMRGALTLENEAFASMRDAENSFARGLVMLVVISLIVGLVLSLVSFAQAVTTSPAQEIAEVQQGMQEVFETMRQFGAFGAGPEAEEFWRIFMQNFEAGLEIGRRVGEAVEQTTPAPSAVVDLFEALGQWISYPFGWVSTWMFYGVLTLLFAKLLGGVATIREMLATTSFVAVPHLLDALNFIPYLGSLIGLIAFFWGLAIYVKGTAIANRFDNGRALLAILAPFIVLFVLIIIFIMFIVALIVLSN